MVDEAGVQVHALAQLGDVDPLVHGVGLGDVAGTDDDHLLHLADVSQAVGAVGDGLGGAGAGQFESGAHQRGVEGGVDLGAWRILLEFQAVLVGALTGFLYQAVGVDPGHGAVVDGADAAHRAHVGGFVVVVDAQAPLGVRGIEQVVAVAFGGDFIAYCANICLTLWNPVLIASVDPAAVVKAVAP